MSRTRTASAVTAASWVMLAALGLSVGCAAPARAGTTPTTAPPTTAPPTTAPPTTAPPTTVALSGTVATTTSPGTTPTTTEPGATTTTTYAPGTGPPPTAAELAEQNAIHRSGPSSTAPLLAALAPLSALGLTPEQIAIIGFGQFPVAGLATYSDDFMQYRSWPEPHMHQGIDIDAPNGTPLISPAAGTLTYSDSDPSGYGLTAIVTQSDKTTYLLAHMSATVLGLASGDQVHQGQVIGFVGATGDSTGPHLDFEVHPFGGPSIDEKPILDEYLAAAIANAPRIVAEYEGHADGAGPPATAGVAARVVVPDPAATVRSEATGRPATTRAAVAAGLVAADPPGGGSGAGLAWRIGATAGLLVSIGLLGVTEVRRRMGRTAAWGPSGGGAGRH